MRGYDGRMSLPPFDAVMDPNVQKWMFIIFGFGALLALVYAVAMARKKKDILPIYLFLAGIASYPVEAMADMLGQCWFPEVGQIVGYKTFGHSIPLFHVLCYAFYFPPAITWMVYRFERGVTVRWLLKLFFLLPIPCYLFEILPIHYHVWIYYGNQPFMIPPGWPLHWGGPGSATFLILTAIITYKALPYLRGWRKVAVIPLMPVSVAGTYSAYALIVNSTLSSMSKLVTSAGAIGSMLTGLFCVWLAGKWLLEKPLPEYL
jgi:hypothetical protein